jgi:hypothetical protein
LPGDRRPCDCIVPVVAGREYPVRAGDVGQRNVRCTRRALVCPDLPKPETLRKPTTVREPWQLPLLPGREVTVVVNGAVDATADQTSAVPN